MDPRPCASPGAAPVMTSGGPVPPSKRRRSNVLKLKVVVGPNIKPPEAQRSPVTRSFSLSSPAPSLKSNVLQRRPAMSHRPDSAIRFTQILLWRRIVLVSLLVAVLGLQWFAAVHRGLHAAGSLFGLSNGLSNALSIAQPTANAASLQRSARIIVSPAMFAGVFEDHPAGSADCLRLDGLLGAQALCGGNAEPGLLQAQFSLALSAQPSIQPVAFPSLPPARAPPSHLI